MKVLIKIPLHHFEGFFDRCDLARPEYLFLKSRIITRDQNNLEVAEISCQLVSAKRLFELAMEIYPNAAPYIEPSFVR